MQMDNSRQYARYADFKKEQELLAEFISKGSEITDALGLERFRDDLARLSGIVKNDSFKVQIVGTFKNGKSTFINSLLGENIMPAYTLPCTAIVNEIKWGETKRAVVHFRDKLPEKLPGGIPQAALEHINQHKNEKIPPMEVPYDEIEKYAVIPLDKSEEFDFQSPYKKIEVFWPLELLKNGVVIVDSPGLNESLTRTEVTMDYIASADAVIFVLDATRILSASEMKVIDVTIKKQGFSDPFIIVNKFDAVRPAEREKMKDFVNNKLGGYTDKDFFFVSARNALAGKRDNNAELLKESGIPDFEKALSVFLVKEKGRAKLSRPIRELKRILNEEVLFKALPMQKNALSYSADEMSDKYDAIKPKLDKLRRQKDLIAGEFERKIEHARYPFMNCATKFLIGLKDAVPVWIREYNPTAKLGAIPTKARIGRVCEEIVRCVTEKIEEAQIKWRSETLMPLVAENANSIFDTKGSDVQSFYDGIDDIAVEFSDGKAQRNDTSAWERATNLSEGLSMGESIFCRTDGNVVINPQALGRVTMGIGAALIIGVLASLTPFAIVSMLIGSITFGAVSGENAQVKKLKAEIIKNAVESVAQKADTFPEEFAENLITRFKAISGEITSSMSTELEETEQRIQNITSEIKKGEDNVSQKGQQLADCEEKLKQLITQLDDMSFRLTS